MAFKVKKLDDIKNLGWAGVFHLDNKRFEACEEFILKSKSKATQRKALELMTEHGMGIKEHVTNAILEEYLECQSA